MGFLDNVLKSIMPSRSRLDKWKYRTPPFFEDDSYEQEQDYDPNVPQEGRTPPFVAPSNQQSEYTIPPVDLSQLVASSDVTQGDGDEPNIGKEGRVSLPPQDWSKFDVPTEGRGTGQTETTPVIPMPRSLDGQQPTQTTPATPENPAVPVPQPQQTQSTQQVNPYRQALEAQIAERRRLEQMQPRDLDQNKDSWLKNFGKTIQMNIPVLQQMLMNPNLNDKQALMMSLGVVAGSGISAAVAPYADEQQQLQYKKAVADKSIADARGLYDYDRNARLQEEQIQSIDDKREQRDRELDQKDTKLKDDRYNFATRRLNAMTQMLKTGQFDAKDNQELVESMSEIVGRKVKLNGFNPAKDKVNGFKVVQDAQGNKAYVVSVTVDGTVKEELLREENGQVAFIKDPRVKAEEIRSNTTLTTTKMRITSSENIAKWNNEAREKLAAMGLNQKEIDGIQEDFYKEYNMTDEDDVIELYAKGMGKSAGDYTLDQREQILREYYDRKREKIARDRGFLRGK